MALQTVSASIGAQNQDGSYPITCGPFGFNAAPSDFRDFLNHLSQRDVFFIYTAQMLISQGVNPRSATGAQLQAAVNATNYPLMQ